jgi:lactoylglutathione lyase
MLAMIAPLEVGICVKNMERMLDFYTKVLGFTYISSFDVPSDKSSVTGITPDGYQVVRLQTNYGERIKLLKPFSVPDTRAQGAYITSRVGNSYITLIVRDIRNIVADLKDSGIKILTQGDICEVREGVYLCVTIDPEGNYLEFVEYSDIKEYRPDI